MESCLLSIGMRVRCPGDQGRIGRYICSSIGNKPKNQLSVRMKKEAGGGFQPPEEINLQESPNCHVSHKLLIWPSADNRKPLRHETRCRFRQIPIPGLS